MLHLWISIILPPRGSFHCGSTMCRGQIHELKNPYSQGNSGCKDGVAKNRYHENTEVWDVSSGWRVSLGIHHKGGCILLQIVWVPWGCLNKALTTVGGLKQQKCLLPHSWRPRVQDHSVSRAGLPLKPPGKDLFQVSPCLWLVRAQFQSPPGTFPVLVSLDTNSLL